MQKQFEPKPSGLLVRAPAKINLVLLVAGKRDDGFHGPPIHSARQPR